MTRDKKVIERLQEYMSIEGIRQIALADRLGWSPQDLSNVLKGRTKVGLKRLDDISKKLSLTFEIGELREKESPALTVKEETADWGELVHKRLAPPKGKPEELLFVNVFPFELAADPKNENHRRLVQSLSLPEEFSEKAPVGLKIKDNSMAPTIKEGAVIGLAFRDKKIIEGEIYILRSTRGAMIRKVFFGIKGYILKADNRAFPDIEASVSDIVVVGRVGWVLQIP